MRYELEEQLRNAATQLKNIAMKCGHLDTEDLNVTTLLGHCHEGIDRLLSTVDPVKGNTDIGLDVMRRMSAMRDAR